MKPTSQVPALSPAMQNAEADYTRCAPSSIPPVRCLSACLFLTFAFAVLACAGQFTWAAPGDLAVSPPQQTSINPCFSVRSSGIRLVDGSHEPAVEMTCGGMLKWTIPEGATSFHVTLWRAEAADAFANSHPAPAGGDPIRVLISLDGTQAVDTILRNSTQAENWTIPVNNAHSLSIMMEEVYGAFAVYLGDPGFSTKSVSSAAVRHVLRAGEAFANLGAGLRQAALFDFHPGEGHAEQQRLRRSS